MKLKVREEDGKSEGLSLTVETPGEWHLMLCLAHDAMGQDAGWLAKRFGVLMDNEDWDEFLAPELTDRFTDEIKKIKKVIEDAYQEARPLLDAPEKEEDEDGEVNLGQIYFSNRQLLPFYSVSNQARLFLNGHWKIVAGEDTFGEALAEDPERAWAIFRDRLFCSIQNFILTAFPDVL